MKFIMKRISIFLIVFLLFNIPVFAQTQLQPYLYNAKRFANERKYAEAIDEISKAIFIEPNEIGLYLIRADYYRKSKNTQAFQTDIDTAISIVNKEIEADAKNAKLYLKRANIYHFAGNKSAVSEDVKTAISLNPNDFEILRGSRRQLTSLGDYEESLKIANKIIELNNSNPFDFHSRSNIKKNLKDFHGAVEDGIKTLELTDMGMQLFALYDIYQILKTELQNDENLLSYYERILVILDKRAVDSYNATPQMNNQVSQNTIKVRRETSFREVMQILKICIELYLKKGMLDKADELIAQITKYEPKDLSQKFSNEMELKQKVFKLIIRGDSFLARKQYEKAIDDYQAAIILNNSEEAHRKLFQAIQLKVEAESK